jgi:peptidyl-Lys metalloendopeptidase
LAILAALFVAVGPASAGPLRAELAPLSSEPIVAGEPALLRFTLTNVSKTDAFVIDYETPLRGLAEDLFHVVRDGRTVPYEGMHALRLGALPENWIKLAPGESVSAVVDLASAYPMHLSGQYRVSYDGALQVFRGAGTPPSVSLDASGRLDEEQSRFEREAAAEALTSEAVFTDVVALVVEGDAEPRAIVPAIGHTRTFSGCTTTQQSALNYGQTNGRANALRAYNAATSFNTWYRTWFGNSSGSVSTVRGRFGNSYNRMNQNIQFFCGSQAPLCSGSIVLYTYKQVTNQIWVCSIYTSQSNTFKAHAVNHETYHWNTVAGADDVTYGSAQCRSLASSNPSAALRNADNYAYAADTAP